MDPLILRADAACLPLPDASVNLIVTSPPYFGQRLYTDAGQVIPGQQARAITKPPRSA